MLTTIYVSIVAFTLGMFFGAGLAWIGVSSAFRRR